MINSREEGVRDYPDFSPDFFLSLSSAVGAG
jgi:hypothetical protein